MITTLLIFIALQAVIIVALFGLVAKSEWDLALVAREGPWIIEEQETGTPRYQVVNRINAKQPPLVFWTRAESILVAATLNKRRRLLLANAFPVSARGG